MDDRIAAVEELKRYLARRHRSGLDVIYRLDPAGGGVRSAEEPEAATPDVERVRKGGRVNQRTDTETAGRRTIEAGTQSIRYRYESQSLAQSSLFSESGPAESVDVRGLDSASLEEIVSTCTRCPLSETRNRTVFGSGSRDARIIFIGEAPGHDEDIQGLPFVGRAGKLLTKILASVGMSRDEVYITNILKCRPPGNRDPQEDEVKACSIFLQRQIELIDPVLICALGRVAGQNLLRSTASLSVLRQNVHFYNDTKVVVMYHPAALLRNPNLKRAAWEDIQMVHRMYDEARGNG